jgi:hypothetical protein
MTVHIDNPEHREKLETEFRLFQNVETVRKGDVEGVRLRIQYGYLEREHGLRLIKRMMARITEKV